MFGSRALVGGALRFSATVSSLPDKTRSPPMLLDQLKTWTPSTKAEKEAVLQQLERLLENPYFHKSKRFPVFLRFVVSEALAGRAEGLKERTLGIEVFCKDPSYDTTQNPIVRVTAGEIRKRIAQYYQEAGHEQEIKLLMPAGSYVPQFYPPEIAVPALPEEAELSELHQIPIAESSQPRGRRTLYAAAFVVLAAAATLLWRGSRSSPIDEFWAPFFGSPDPIVLCVADQNQYSTIVLRDAADTMRHTTLISRMVAVI